MRLLLDNGLSPRLADALRSHGLDVAHVRDLGLHAATDLVVLQTALAQLRILVTLDGDFAALLAHGGLGQPSLVHLRSRGLGTPAKQLPILLRALEGAQQELAAGAIVTIRGEQIRIHRLPVH